MIKNFKTTFSNNKKVIENYFFMTLLQILNSLFYLLIYPFLIRTLGTESYGLYIFATSVVNYFISLVSFGFDFPAAKAIVQHQMDHGVKTRTLSCVFTAKIYLEIFSTIIFLIVVILSPSIRQHWQLYAIYFANTLVNILFPTWYFQGIQKMRLVTIIQLSFKFLSLPLIFLTITGNDDTLKFAIIVTVLNLAGAGVAAYLIHVYEKIHIKWMPLDELKSWFKDALPFFWSTAGASIKQQSIPIIIGSFFNMTDVALYDLAYKIFTIPQILFGSINGALFPKIAIDNRKSVIKKVLFYEMLAGFLVIVTIFILGKWFILILGGTQMLGAYPIAIVLSFGVLTFLIVGGYINFIFVPQKKYYFVALNQLVAFVTFFVLTAIGLLIYKNIISIAIAWSIAGLIEILFCYILIRKYKLF